MLHYYEFVYDIKAVEYRKCSLCQGLIHHLDEWKHREWHKKLGQ